MVLFVTRRQNDFVQIAKLDRGWSLHRNPLDVSIVGYDDVPMAALPSYALTTIRQPVHEMAKAAMEILGLAGERGAQLARHADHALIDHGSPGCAPVARCCPA
jgi:DNA-binding LacI/PurR family transcriptional regulator